MKAVLTEEVILTEEQLQVLDGAMLGDGSLIIHKQGKNAYFSYLSKSKQHVEFVSNYFKEYWSGEGIKENFYFDKRTEKEYYRSYIRTYTNIGFTKQYNRWYFNNIKKIPPDLKLTPLSCLIWYIGDGGFVRSKRSEYIKLSTQCFLKEDLEKIILPQLKEFEPSLMKADIGKDGRQQYFIYIPHRKEQEFLEYIGECPFEDYKYKWEFTPYKNSKPKSHKEHEQEFCEKYKKGMTYYAIAKEYGIEPNIVKHYLIKNNLYKAPNKKLQNVIIHLSEDGNYINIYESGADAAKKLNLSSSMISSVKSGRRKMRDNSYFKYYKDFNKEEQEKIKEKFQEYFK